MSSQTYPPEFKREVANCVLEQNDAHREATEAIGVSQTSLKPWLQQTQQRK